MSRERQIDFEGLLKTANARRGELTEAESVRKAEAQRRIKDRDNAEIRDVLKKVPAMAKAAAEQGKTEFEVWRMGRSSYETPGEGDFGSDNNWTVWWGIDAGCRKLGFSTRDQQIQSSGHSSSLPRLTEHILMASFEKKKQ